jgi:hypothetical protein
MPAEVLKFRTVGNGRFTVEIWGDFLDDCGVMHVDDLLPFLERLRIIAATPQEVVEWLRKGEGVDVLIEKRKYPK